MFLAGIIFPSELLLSCVAYLTCDRQDTCKCRITSSLVMFLCNSLVVRPSDTLMVAQGSRDARVTNVGNRSKAESREGNLDKL